MEFQEVLWSCAPWYSVFEITFVPTVQPTGASRSHKSEGADGYGEDTGESAKQVQPMHNYTEEYFEHDYIDSEE